jgi:hypothetical protein
VTSLEENRPTGTENMDKAKRSLAIVPAGSQDIAAAFTEALGRVREDLDDNPYLEEALPCCAREGCGGPRPEHTLDWERVRSDGPV